MDGVTARPQERKAPPWRKKKGVFEMACLGAVPLAARPPDLRDDSFAVSPSGKMIQRSSDDQRVEK